MHGHEGQGHATPSAITLSLALLMALGGWSAPSAAQETGIDLPDPGLEDLINIEITSVSRSVHLKALLRW